MPLLRNPSSVFLYFEKKMVKIGGVLVCMLIVAMDVVAGVLGIQAEIAQNKAC